VEDRGLFAFIVILFIDLFVLFVYVVLFMKRLQSKNKRKRLGPPRGSVGKSSVGSVAEEIPLPNAFLEEAKNEPKRKLLIDHIQTINVLRNEKRFTFRAIAEWLTARGIETDHSSVYRAYLSALPEDQRDPDTDWDSLELQPD
jgi:hypothetical protein